MQMIDTHCHLLPGIDDGARNIEQSLQMARTAVDEGIAYSVMTPHIHPGRYENTRSVICAAADKFQLALKSAGIPLNIGVAAEVRLSPEVLGLVERDEIPFLGELDGYRIMLLEFPHSHIPPGAAKLVESLFASKIRPIIAHPERNKAVIRDLRKLRPFVDMGCILQLTASAVAGGFGAGPHECANKILRMDALKILATDAHNLKARQPRLRDGRDAAAKLVGEQAADDMVFANPLSLVWSQMQSSRLAA
jgi:protein-tyrosine phosphatase